MEVLHASTNFVLTVNANTPPTITAIGPQSTNQDTPTSPIAFTIGDAQTSPNALTLSATSSNATLVPVANIVFGGSGAGRNAVITPASGLSGTSTITVTVSDGTLTASTNFVLTVNAANTPPTITAIGPQSTNQDTPTGSNCFYSWGCRNFTERIDAIRYLVERNAGPGCQHRLWRKRSRP